MAYPELRILGHLRRTHLNLGGCLSGTDFMAVCVAIHVSA